MTATSAEDAVRRLKAEDASLVDIILYGAGLGDAKLAELVDCLLAHPDVVRYVSLGRNRLTDETGVKLARYLAASTVVHGLALSGNACTQATHTAMAWALCFNTSLAELDLAGNDAADFASVERALAFAVRVNPNRPADSEWFLHMAICDEFYAVVELADQLPHPSMQWLLLVHLHHRSVIQKVHFPAIKMIEINSFK